MKTGTNLIITAILLLGISMNAVAQRGQGKGMRMNPDNDMNRMYMNIPDLTDEQKEKIRELRVKHLKEVTDMRNQIREKMARIRSLTTGDNTDIAQAKKLADEVGVTKAQLMKARIDHRDKVRSLLTNEQKVYFDARMHKVRKGRGYGMRGGRGLHRFGQGHQDCPYYQSNR